MPEKENWNKRWIERDTPWSYPEADNAFYEDFTEVSKHLKKSDSLKALIPLSGSSPSIKYLYEKNFKVTAVEFSEAAIIDLKNSLFPMIPFDISGEKHWANNIEIYNSDFFLFNADEKFDLIYDRAAFVAIDPYNREKYIEKLLQLSKPGSLLYLSLFEWDSNDEYGPPFSSPLENVEKMLPNFKKIFSRKLKEEKVSDKMKNAGISYFYYTHSLFIRE